MISIYKDFDDIPEGLNKKGWKAPAVLQKLRDIYHNKCAYCEEKFTPENTPVIHHYRPKDKYSWLENEWSNLLPICPQCNMAVKDSFITEGKPVTSPPKESSQWRADSPTLLAEKPLLLHPEIDTPENHLYIDKYCYLKSTTNRGEHTIQTFNLNSMSPHESSHEQSLVKNRRKIRNTLFYDLKKAHDEYLQKPDSTKGKSLHSIYFEDFFKNLKETRLPGAEFSLLGQYMIEDFDSFFTEPENLTVASNKDFVEQLKKSRPLYLKSTDRIKTVDSEKIVPLFSSSPEDDEMKKEGLPYAVKSFDIMKYCGIKHTGIKNLPINTRWIFLTGENGFGKTLVLQALALGLMGKKDGNLDLADDNCRVKIEMKSKRDNLFYIAGSRLHVPFNNLVAYGPMRLSIHGEKVPGQKVPQKDKKSDSLFRNTPTLNNIQEDLIGIHDHRSFESKYDAIIKALKKLLPQVEEIIVDGRPGRERVLYIEKAENGDLLAPISFGALSAGSRSIIALVGDMIIELYQHQPEIVNPADLEGIILIDELDIHLHAKWQREFVLTLTETFPKIQFIASTHSPIPLLGAPRETILLNVEKKSKKEGIVINRLDIDLTRLTPNTIFSSPIFDFQEIVSSAHDENQLAYPYDNYSDVEKSQQLDEELKQSAQSGPVSLKDLLED
ncbi:MAG: AAA family ATPase [bacterium]|nr:AAA family ATPase [bacterium]